MSRRSNRDQRRAEIASALGQVMAHKGYDGATIADIAKAAGLRSGLVHYHFESKLEILQALLDQIIERHRATLSQALNSADKDPKDQLRAYIDVHLALGRTADATMLLCWVAIGGEALRQPEIQAQYARALQESRRRLVEIIETGKGAQLFSVEDPEAAAAALLALIQGYFSLAGTARDLIPTGSAARSAKRMAAGLLGLSTLEDGSDAL